MSPSRFRDHRRTSSRPHLPASLTVCAVLAACAAFTAGPTAVAEARQLGTASSLDTAGAGPTAGPVAPLTPVGPGFMPHVPPAVTRPDAWPGGRLPATPDLDRVTLSPVDKEKHVLSSILPRPGGQLRTEAGTKPDAADSDAGVIQAGFEQPVSGGAPLGEEVSLETAQVVARVGPEVVLESDLLTPKALDWLASVSPGLKPEQVRELRLKICEQVIQQHIETLLVYVDACREIPEDKLPEIRKSVDKAFDEQVLPKMMQEAGAANSLEFEQSLRAKGQSLDRMRKTFFERGLAQEWVRKRVKTNEEVAHADMIAWYQNHLADYDFPAKARFETLTVKTGLKRSRQQAWDLIASMGNEVLAGRAFAEVAKARSEGPTASQGGAFDWTTKGSLASKTLDEAIFSLPVGQLSTILEDGDTALHIVRVVERSEAGRVPFIEAQVDIRQRLLDERRKAGSDEYFSRLRERTPVWTVFDDKTAGPGRRTMTAGRPSAATPR